MWKFAALVLLASLAAGEVQTQTKERRASCWDTALTQAAMNECAAADARRAEEELDRTYGELLARATATNGAAVPKIKAAQAAWLAYRDAQIEATFADDRKQEALWNCLSDVRQPIPHADQRNGTAVPLRGHKTQATPGR